MSFNKPPLTLQEQITQLKSRGLIIENEASAEHYLGHISYYRLSAYWWPLQADKQKHIFKDGSSFDRVIELYNFDRKLRLLLFDAIERIEIAFRTKLVYHLSLGHGFWWYENPKLFKSKHHHALALKNIDQELQRSKEVFVKQHYVNYGYTDRPPALKAFEILSLGMISKFYANLKGNVKEKNVIAHELGLPDQSFIPSWFIAINLIRNFSAHHARIWNRKLPTFPKWISTHPYNYISKPDVPQQNRLWPVISSMLYLLNVVSPGHAFKEKFIDLVDNSPFIDIVAMGFPENWKGEKIWK